MLECPENIKHVAGFTVQSASKACGTQIEEPNGIVRNQNCLLICGARESWKQQFE